MTTRNVVITNGNAPDGVLLAESQGKMDPSGREPDVTANVYLVPHGYQIDVKLAGGEQADAIVCRDFAGTYPDLGYLREVLADHLIQAMRDFEKKLKQVAGESDSK